MGSCEVYERGLLCGGFTMNGDLLTIIFGLTSGVLTLVGLTAIFVSINSQHNIQKGRELIWGIMSLPLEIKDYTDPQNANRLCKYYWLYKDIINTSGDFTKRIILLSQFAIGGVCILWMTILFFNFDIVYIIAIAFSIIILIGFIVVLGNLNNITQIASLPPYDNLLNADSNLEVNIHIPALAASSATVEIIKNNATDFSASIGVALPFVNLSVLPIVIARNSSKEYLMEIIQSKAVNQVSIDGNGRCSLGIANIWYELTEFRINDEVKKKSTNVDFQLNFSSKHGTSEAHYSISISDLEALDFGGSFYLMPYRVHNNFVLCEDGKRIHWGLNK